MGPSGIQWPLTVTFPEGSTAVIVSPSGHNPTATVTVSDTPSMMVMETAAQPGGGTVTVVVTPTLTPIPVTVVFVSLETETVTTTVSGMSTVFTTTSVNPQSFLVLFSHLYACSEVALSTTTAVVSMAPSSERPDYTGFLPINAAWSTTSRCNAACTASVFSVASLLLLDSFLRLIYVL